MTKLPIIDHMDSLDKQKKQIIENLLKTIPENEKVLDRTSAIIANDQADAVAKKWGELCFYIAYIDNEVKYMLQAILLDEKAFIYLNKYIALIMHEAIEALPKLYGEFSKILREVEAKDGQRRFDREKLDEGYQKYREALKPIKKDDEFMQSIRAIRNNVAAHHLSKERNVHALIDWYVGKFQEIGKQNNPGVSSLMLYAAQVAQSLYPLSQSLIHAVQTEGEHQ